MVKGITKDSAAEEVGIKSQDIIVGLDKNGITHFQELINYVSKMKEKESLQLQIYRDGQLRELECHSKREEIDGKIRNMIGVYTSIVFTKPKMVQTRPYGYFRFHWQGPHKNVGNNGRNIYGV